MRARFQTVYLGAGEFANATGVGAVAGTVSVADASITSAGRLTIASLETDWENTADDGVFLFEVISGDFDMSVQVIGPIETGNYNLPGLMVRAFGANGSPCSRPTARWPRTRCCGRVSMNTASPIC